MSMPDRRYRDAAAGTPDPDRAEKNLLTFLEENPEKEGEIDAHLRSISLLFSCSQFLANYSIANAETLFRTLRDIDMPREEGALACRLHQNLPSGSDMSSPLSPAYQMSVVRSFKMEEILRITLRDILRKVDLVETMYELSALADVVIACSLDIVKRSMAEVYGLPDHEAFSVISLGKLGGEELNFSSDIDLMFVYGTEKGETSGIRTSQGIITNRISNHEYYCKVGEALTRFLSQNSDAGSGYRVDLRLRPEGQRGDIALALRGYEMYYESWGRAWERAVLIRARPVAGDEALGNEFLEMVRPFVYRKYLDFSAIDEIRKMKMRIDSHFKKGDIKRGYGGIREVEFFAQALQLIYGGREYLLRERSVLKVLHRLLQKGLIGQEDYFILTDNYRFLRTLEHRLQQLNDLQTHTIPTGEAEAEALGRKMGFSGRTHFLDDLDVRRKKVRDIYDSLFAGKKDDAAASGTFFDEELSDIELKEYLSQTGVKELDKAARNIRLIKDSTFAFQTLRGRRLLGEILPLFVDAALKSDSPDMALNHLQAFAGLLSSNESYLDMFRKNRELVELLVYVFSQSEYISKVLISRPKYLEMIGWQGFAKKSLSFLREEIAAGIAEGNSLNDAIRLIRQAEEMRLGLLFLQKKISIADVVRGLSKTAEAILTSCVEHAGEGMQGMVLVAFGKLGGREITFNSDLDLIFVSSGEVSEASTKAAERFLRMLISYTREGIAYRVDTRLRPEGSKGPLVSSIEGFQKYYGGAAAFWEFQALLKARPVAGDMGAGRSFMRMAKDTLTARGKNVLPEDILQMRERILRERSKEAEGYDIKLGPGGIEEIEFAVQFLQLRHCADENRILVQGTMSAVERLRGAGIIDNRDAHVLRETYHFYRTIESFLRLRGDVILRRNDERLANAAVFMGFESMAKFVESLELKRRSTRQLYQRFLMTV